MTMLGQSTAVADSDTTDVDTSDVRGNGRTRLAALIIICVSALVLVWSRLALVNNSLWYDEITTVQDYVSKGPRGIFFGTYIPNNHVLFSLLTWATTEFVGHFEAAYRLWSVVPGLAAVGVVAWWSWRRLGPAAAAGVVVLFTVAPDHLLLTPQARGYGLGMLAGAGMLVAAARASDHADNVDVVAFAAFGLIGIWTLPVFVLTFVAQGAALAVSRPV